MASSLSSFMSITIFTIMSFIIFFFILPTESTSRGHNLSHHHSKKAQTGIRVTLKHVDSGKNLTKFNRLQLAMKRGKHRLHRLNAMVLATDESNLDLVSSPVNAGNGEFLMKLSIGTPPLDYSAIMDTGSDLIWTQCKPCKECFKQPTAIFDPLKSSSFSKLSCSSDLCEALPSSTCSNGCEYMYSYGDYSSTQGIMATETFTFGEVSVPKLGFGCGEDNEGNGFTQGGGLVGLGRGPLSLVSQLGEPKFSYCLTSIDDSKSTSTLLLGSLATGANTSSDAKSGISTPLIKNKLQPSFYYLSLEGITIGDTQLPIKKSTFALNEDGSGGVIIDSGTTITYLEESAFELVKNEFVKNVNLEVDDSGSTGLELCFKLSSSSGNGEVEVPKFVFNFKGGDLELPAENYVIADSSVGVLCLAMGSSRGMSIIGNVQQQNFLVLHDLEKQIMSFTQAQCDQL